MQKISMGVLILLLFLTLGYTYFQQPAAANDNIRLVEMTFSEKNGEVMSYAFEDAELIQLAMGVYDTLLSKRNPQSQQSAFAVTYHVYEANGNSWETLFDHLDANDFTKFFNVLEAKEQKEAVLQMELPTVARVVLDSRQKDSQIILDNQDDFLPFLEAMADFYTRWTVDKADLYPLVNVHLLDDNGAILAKGTLYREDAASMRYLTLWNIDKSLLINCDDIETMTLINLLDNQRIVLEDKEEIAFVLATQQQYSQGETAVFVDYTIKNDNAYQKQEQGYYDLMNLPQHIKALFGN